MIRAGILVLFLLFGVFALFALERSSDEFCLQACFAGSLPCRVTWVETETLPATVPFGRLLNSPKTGFCVLHADDVSSARATYLPDSHWACRRVSTEYRRNPPLRCRIPLDEREPLRIVDLCEWTCKPWYFKLLRGLAAIFIAFLTLVSFLGVSFWYLSREIR